MTKILITGGTGLVGKHLTKKLVKLGYEVAVLSRNPKNDNEYKWNISQRYIDQRALEGTNYIIHLAGAGIADKRWTSKQKEIIINSRTQTANLLFEKIKQHDTPVKKIISASGIGYYGAITSPVIFKETDKPSKDYISKVCIAWEKAIQQFENLNISITILRTGVVLAEKKSALQKINTPFFLSALGSGKQYLPWIHIDDLCNLYIKSIQENSFVGSFNAVAPDIHTNNSFTKVLSDITKKTMIPVNVPSFVMKLVFGEMANILLEGSRISSEKVQKEYDFYYPDLKSALMEIYKNKKVQY